MKHLIIYFLLLASHFLLPASAEAADEAAVITADRMEFISQRNIYVADGNVTITFGDVVLTADEVLVDRNSNDALASGNVTYKDPDADITADRIELNLKTKIGTIYDSYIHYRKNNYRLRSGEIRKTGDRTFSLDKATATTCDADPPEWQISSSDIQITQDKSMTGWHGTFNIGNVPVLYMPYFWTPLIRERQTGLLFPSFGFSSERGLYYKQGFFWAIKESQDATLYLDYYDKKGFGEGLDYRYILSPDSDGEVWLYHVTDKEPSRNLAEIKSYHNQKFPNDISGYLKIHAVSEQDYYSTLDSTSSGRFGLSSWEPTRFGFASDERVQKYLESDFHLAKQYYNSRLYLLAQGRQSLEGPSSEIPQTLPELGFVINTQSKKYFSFDAAVRGVNFWRDKGQEGTRFDVNPNLYFSYGRLLNFTQKAGLKESAYFLNEPSEFENRLLYDLETTLTTKLFKKYSSFIHIVEPSLQYNYVPFKNQDNILAFDPTDSIPKTNHITYALTNRISGLGTKYLETRFRLSQSYSLLEEDELFTPLLAEATLSSSKVDISVNASYDVDDSSLTDMIGSVILKSPKGYVAFGKNLRRSTALDQYSFGAGLYHPIKLINKSLPMTLSGTVYYNADDGRFQEVSVTSIYKKQCWGYLLTYIDRFDEFQVIFAVEFTGLGTFSLGSLGSDTLRPETLSPEGM